MRVSLYIYFVSCFFWCATAFGIAAKVTDIEFPSDIADNKLTVSVEILDIKQALSGKTYFVENLSIVLNNIGSTSPIPYGKPGSGHSYYYILQGTEEVLTENGETDVNATIEIIASGSALQDTLNAGSNKISGSIKYQDTSGQSDAGSTFEFSYTVRYADAAPELLTVRGSFRSLIAKIVGVTTIKYNDNAEREPTGLVMYVTKADQGVINLAAATANNGSDSDSVCQFDTNSQGESCITDCDNTKYIKLEQGDARIKIGTAAKGADSVTVVDLGDSEDDTSEQIGFVVFRPNSLQRSACFRRSLSRDYTYSESNDPDADPELGEPACFIATAAYGSPLAVEIEHFRWLREQLRVVPGGTQLINFYYYVSPPLARLVHRNAWLGHLSRIVLTPIARLIEIWRDASGSLA